MTLKKTELELTEELVGRLATVTEPTHTGTRTILGTIVTPLLIEEVAGEEVVTAVTLEGQVLTETITGLPIPLAAEEPAHQELIPIEAVRLL